MYFMKSLFSFILIYFVFVSSYAQSNSEEYNKLLKNTKKPNITHFKINLGLGIVNLDKYPIYSHSIYPSRPEFNRVDSGYNLSSSLMVQLTGCLDVDIIETKRAFLNFNGFYRYGYWKDKKAKSTPPALAGFDLPEIIDENGHHNLNQYEVSLKVGYGGEDFKFYVLGGLGSFNFKYDFYMKSSIPIDDDTPVGYESWDTGHLKFNYTKAGVGIRIGNNRQKDIFDFNVYKLLPGGSFFQATERRGIGLIGSFGKYKDNYPALPIGFFMSYQRRGKYEVSIDFRKLREKDYTDKNADSFTLTFSKQFDIYDKKKK